MAVEDVSIGVVSDVSPVLEPLHLGESEMPGIGVEWKPVVGGIREYN